MTPSDPLNPMLRRAQGRLLGQLAGDAFSPPAGCTRHQGCVLIAFHNAFWQLPRPSNLGEGVVDTVMRGGDTDTNACIVGALRGALYGREAVPER